MCFSHHVQQVLIQVLLFRISDFVFICLFVVHLSSSQILLECIILHPIHAVIQILLHCFVAESFQYCSIETNQVQLMLSQLQFEFLFFYFLSVILSILLLILFISFFVSLYSICFCTLYNLLDNSK